MPASAVRLYILVNFCRGIVNGGVEERKWVYVLVKYNRLSCVWFSVLCNYEAW